MGSSFCRIQRVDGIGRASHPPRRTPTDKMLTEMWLFLRRTLSNDSFSLQLLFFIDNASLA